MNAPVNYIPIELEGKVYNLVADVEEVTWFNKERDFEQTSLYDAYGFAFNMQDGSTLIAYKDELDRETLEYIYQFVDPV